MKLREVGPPRESVVHEFLNLDFWLEDLKHVLSLEQLPLQVVHS